MIHIISVRPKTVRRVAAVLAALTALLLAGPRPQAAHAPSHHHVMRLHFRPGQSHLVVRGFISEEQGGRDYAFSAKAGQRLRIDLIGIPPPGEGSYGGIVPTYIITFPSGKQYQPKGDPFDGHLTETGTYRIGVGINNMATNSSHGSYRMTLTRTH